ncbi:hypothetical protein D5086_002347, partial [Populus alba]
QRLHIICNIGPSESLGLGVFQVTTDEAREMITRQQEGPIVFLGINDGTTCEPSNYRVWNCFEWKRQNTDCVSKWNTSDERKSKSRDDAFWVPRYFPFCQIAERSGSLEFFGFTTSARKNRPQLLIGASSTLQTLRIPELAAAFCVSEERVKRVNRYGTARGCYIAFSNCSTTR